MSPSERAAKTWADPEIRETRRRAMSEAAKKRWSDPANREALSVSLRGNPKLSLPRTNNRRTEEALQRWSLLLKLSVEEVRQLPENERNKLLCRARYNERYKKPKIFVRLGIDEAEWKALTPNQQRRLREGRPQRPTCVSRAVLQRFYDAFGITESQYAELTVAEKNRLRAKLPKD